MRYSNSAGTPLRDFAPPKFPPDILLTAVRMRAFARRSRSPFSHSSKGTLPSASSSARVNWAELRRKGANPPRGARPVWIDHYVR